MKPLVAGFPSNRHKAMGVVSGVRRKMCSFARLESIKLEVAPESINVGTGLRRPGSRHGTRNEVSELEESSANRLRP
jgi:hypothetical protein